MNKIENHTINSTNRTPKQINILAKFNYTGRISGCVLLGISVCSVMLEGKFFFAWFFALFQFVLWPHIAFGMCVLSNDSKQAEYRNLLIDSFFLGLWLPILSFRVVPAAVGIIPVCVDNAMSGGIKFLLKSFLFILMGIFTGILLIGHIEFIPETGFFTTVVCLVCITLYLTLIGLGGYRNSNLLTKKGSELVKAKIRAEKATYAKNVFITNLSHEIRTPMNAIIGLSRLAIDSALSNRHYDYLEKIKSSSQSLLGIINNILDISKIEVGKLDIVSVDFCLEHVINDVSNMISFKTETKGIELIIDIKKDLPVFLIGDPVRLGQILLNLLNNAEKFTTAGQIILRIRNINGVGTDASDRVKLHFSVEDSGIGLTDKQITNLFQAFYQVDSSTTRKYAGTGLGLKISKQLVELMGGEIWVESEFGQGSTFNFTVEIGLQQQIVNQYEFSDDIENMRVLIVNENVTAREILSGMLEDFHFKVDSFPTALAAAEAIEHKSTDSQYQLALLESKPFKLDGIDALKQTSCFSDGSNCKTVLLVPPNTSPESCFSREGSVVHAILTKPVTPSALYETVMNIFEKAETSLTSTKRNTPIIEGLADIRGARILLVDDDTTNQEVAAVLLESKGFDVTVAANGNAAITYVHTDRPFDAVLMDIQMPEMDGYQVTRTLRKDNRFKQLPIIAMTAHVMAEEKQKCIDAGMNDHISKPLDLTMLFSVLVKWIPPLEQNTLSQQDGTALINQSKSDVEKDTTIELPNHIQGLNLHSGLEKVGGVKGRYYSVLHNFKISYKDFSVNVTAEYGRCNMNTVQEMIHTISSAAGNIGANDLHEIAIDIERCMKKNLLQGMDHKLSKLNQALNIVLSSIELFVQPDVLNKIEKNCTPNTDKVIAILTVVDELLSESRTESDYLFGTVTDDLIKLGFTAQTKKLSDKIDRFEYEEAREIVLLLKNKINNI